MASKTQSTHSRRDVVGAGATMSESRRFPCRTPIGKQQSMLMLMGLSRFLLLRRLDQRPPRNDGKTIERNVAFPRA
jgi:hypothetical protein